MAITVIHQFRVALPSNSVLAINDWKVFAVLLFAVHPRPSFLYLA